MAPLDVDAKHSELAAQGMVVVQSHDQDECIGLAHAHPLDAINWQP
jgi:hypothetical protein